MGSKRLTMIALDSMGLSLGWRVANSIARVIKVVCYATWRLNLIANSVPSIVINPIFGASVVLAVIHVVWAIAHVVGRVIHVVLAVLHVVWRIV